MGLAVTLKHKERHFDLNPCIDPESKSYLHYNLYASIVKYFRRKLRVPVGLALVPRKGGEHSRSRRSICPYVTL